MSAPSANEHWIIEAGDAVIQKKAREGLSGLSSLEQLIYCLWVADYGMRNAGELDTARDLYPGFQTEAAQLAQELKLPATQAAFALLTTDLQSRYFERFDEICDEIRDA